MSATQDKQDELRAEGWPSWVYKTDSRCDFWFVSRVLVPLHRKIKSYALYTPSQLLLDLDNIGITRLRHYKKNEDWDHEFVRADIRLNTSGPTLPMSALSLIYERTFHDNGKPVMEVILNNPHAADNITFYLEEEADIFIQNEERALELSDMGTGQLNSRFFSLAILGFILERHSSKNPEYNIRSTMCYWYAGSTLDCLNFVLKEARQEMPLFAIYSTNAEVGKKAGILRFLFWDVSGYVREFSDWSCEPQTAGPLIAAIVKHAVINAQRFRVCIVLGLQIRELCEKNPEEQDNILRRHLVMKSPLTITRRKGCYVLHPVQSPAYLLLQEFIMDEKPTQSLAEAAGIGLAPAPPVKALIQKARELFYGHNKFMVLLEAVPLFFRDKARARKEPTDIAQLIRNMAVIIAAPEPTDDDPTGQSDDDVRQYKLYRDFKRVSQKWIQKQLDILKDLDEQAKIEVVLLTIRGEQAWPALNCLRQDIAPKLVELGQKFSQLRVQECVTDDGSEWITTS